MNPKLFFSRIPIKQHRRPTNKYLSKVTYMNIKKNDHIIVYESIFANGVQYKIFTVNKIHHYEKNIGKIDNNEMPIEKRKHIYKNATKKSWNDFQNCKRIDACVSLDNNEISKIEIYNLPQFENVEVQESIYKNGIKYDYQQTKYFNGIKYIKCGTFKRNEKPLFTTIHNLYNGVNNHKTDCDTN